MIDHLLRLVAPHICCSCGHENAVLCENCFFDIKDEPFGRCIGCLQPTSGGNVCGTCRVSFGVTNAWVVGERTDALKQLLDLYKFERVHEAAEVTARLLDASLPILPSETVVCYVPDIPAHRRQRGYDHMKRIAQLFAERRGLVLSPLLNRHTYRSQRGRSKNERQVAQENAFYATSHHKHVLLIDDIYTTGATLSAGTKALHVGGVQNVYLGVVARQPLDDMRDL